MVTTRLKLLMSILGENKRKILFVLRTSKTHWRNVKPQLIKINELPTQTSEKTKINNYHSCLNTNNYCPFKILQEFVMERPSCKSYDEPFFVFADRSEIHPSQVLVILRKILSIIGVNPMLYAMHSYRIGRATDLVGMGISVETTRKLGRWRSNVVFDYLR